MYKNVAVVIVIIKMSIYYRRRSQACVLYTYVLYDFLYFKPLKMITYQFNDKKCLKYFVNVLTIVSFV